MENRKIYLNNKTIIVKNAGNMRQIKNIYRT